MYRFFVEEDQILDGKVHISGSDVNHIHNVLRMRPGEKILVSTGGEKEYHCVLEEETAQEVTARIVMITDADRELPCRITLFQGLPKGDKMELIVQKAVELGVSEVVPVEMQRSVVKLDVKKAEKRTERWQAIAVSAAKQSKRMVIPEVSHPVSFSRALELMQNKDIRLMPFEHAEGMKHTREVFECIRPGESIGILIGPEGGISEEEVQEALSCGTESITLGRRILRTETAGMMVLSILAYLLEGRKEES